MDQEFADAINEYHLCPLCMFGDSEWDQIVKHLVESHTNEEALDYLGYDPRLEYDTDSIYPSVVP